MTEEDTFLALRKQPYHILRSMVDNIDDTVWWSSQTEEFIDSWFKSRGWTYREYAIEYRKKIRERLE